MNINRNTYEEYFLLYIDNELSASERRAVEEFVAANPDLRGELEMLQDTVLPSEEAVTIDKDLLFRSNQPVTAENCEEYFVLYGDHELSREEQEYVEQFVYRHPQFQANFEAVLRSRATPELSVVFENKEILYRTEKKDRPVVYMRFLRVAVAAAVLLFVGGAGWYYNSRSTEVPGGLANNGPVKQSPVTQPSAVAETPTPATNQLATNTNTDGDAQVAPATGSKTSVPASNVSFASTSKKSSNRSNISALPTVQHKTTETPVIDTKEINEPAPEMIASNLQVEKHIVDRAVTEEEIRSGKLNSEAIDATESNDNNVVYVANTTVNKKNKLRGVFRKASRIFEKATNIDPTEGDRAVRIAGFEIALK